MGFLRPSELEAKSGLQDPYPLDRRCMRNVILLLSFVLI